MRKFSVGIIGGGPAGMTAAISSARRGRSVVICDRMEGLGKKLLASGNGRCNLSNEKLDESYYNSSSRGLVRSILEKFDKVEIDNYFKSLGLHLYSDEGRIFPITNQSSSVLRVFELELKRLAVTLEAGFEAKDVSFSGGVFTIGSTSGEGIECDNIILASGGKSYPALGSDGSAYRLVTHFGHKLITPVPAAVTIVAKSQLCHILQGQRIFARVKSIIDSKIAGESSGELLFTKYGLSGSVILDISDEVSIAVNRHNKKNVSLSIDVVPFIKKDILTNEVSKRIKAFSKEEIMTGILPNKFSIALRELYRKRDPQLIASELKDMRFRVIGTRGWNEAEFTAGGIDTQEVKRCTLESKLKGKLYFAGEVLDVNGKRGGYNLAWAWASGFIAGKLN